MKSLKGAALRRVQKKSSTKESKSSITDTTKTNQSVSYHDNQSLSYHDNQSLSYHENQPVKGVVYLRSQESIRPVPIEEGNFVEPSNILQG